MKGYSPSANIEYGVSGSVRYIVTPNAQRVAGEIVSQWRAGVHSFIIIGTYGTGKSSFLLQLERDLLGLDAEAVLLKTPEAVGPENGVEIVNVVGEYGALEQLLLNRLRERSSGDTAIESLRNYYNWLKRQKKMLLIVVDEFGKVLEYAAKNSIEKELYFLQQLAEFVNVPSRNILLLASLHQNFNTYASKLSHVQKNEWTKVRGRFQEVVFAEPVEQLLHLAAESLDCKDTQVGAQVRSIYEMALRCKLVLPTLREETMRRLYPLDAFSAVVLTRAIQKYGQNERSLFSFLNANGLNSLGNFRPTSTCTYNLSLVYDYLVANFHSYLLDAHADSMGWQAVLVAVERVETATWPTARMLGEAVKTVKAIGLLNLFGGARFAMPRRELVDYMQQAMSIERAGEIVERLVALCIIRYAEYKSRFILFEGTDVDIEEEISKASAIVPPVSTPIDLLRRYFGNPVVTAKEHYYRSGTPRYFEYLLSDRPQVVVPSGAIDGFIELIFPTRVDVMEEVLEISAGSSCALVFGVFKRTDTLVARIRKIQVYDHIIQKVLIDKADRVALREFNKLKAYESSLLQKELKQSFFFIRRVC